MADSSRRRVPLRRAVDCLMGASIAYGVFVFSTQYFNTVSTPLFMRNRGGTQQAVPSILEQELMLPPPPPPSPSQQAQAQAKQQTWDRFVHRNKSAHDCVRGASSPLVTARKTGRPATRQPPACSRAAGHVALPIACSLTASSVCARTRRDPRRAAQAPFSAQHRRRRLWHPDVAALPCDAIGSAAAHVAAAGAARRVLLRGGAPCQQSSLRAPQRRVCLTTRVHVRHASRELAVSTYARAVARVGS